MVKAITPKTKKVKLALQGGASFGAFQWGVMDRLLEDERIEVTAVSGASIGAMNAAAIADGLDRGSNKEARKALHKLWDRLCSNSPNKKLSSKLQDIFSIATFNIQKAMKEQLNKAIDFQALQKNKNGVPIFISALDAQTRKARIFTRKDISVEAVQASGAVPILIGPVEVEGRKYYDGALIENPAIESMSDIEGDVLVVQTFPTLENQDLSKTTLTNIMMNSSMFKDITHIQKNNALVDQNPDAAKALGLKKTHTHMINIGRPVKGHKAMVFNGKHLDKLFTEGRQAADAWLKKNFDNLNVKSTFMGNYKPSKLPPQHSKTPTRKK